MGKNQVQGKSHHKLRGGDLIESLVVGEMVFDPVEQRWKGNEKELSKFGNASRPALISQTGPTTERLEKDGMDGRLDTMANCRCGS